MHYLESKRINDTIIPLCLFLNDYYDSVIYCYLDLNLDYNYDITSHVTLRSLEVWITFI